MLFSVELPAAEASHFHVQVFTRFIFLQNRLINSVNDQILMNRWYSSVWKERFMTEFGESDWSRRTSQRNCSRLRLFLFPRLLQQDFLQIKKQTAEFFQFLSAPSLDHLTPPARCVWQVIWCHHRSQWGHRVNAGYQRSYMLKSELSLSFSWIQMKCGLIFLHLLRCLWCINVLEQEIWGRWILFVRIIYKLRRKKKSQLLFRPRSSRGNSSVVN